MIELLRFIVQAARAMRTAMIWRWLIHCHAERTMPTMNSALIFAPHQDDETLGCGGIIALKRQAGVPVHIVFLTDGSKGAPGPTKESVGLSERTHEANGAPFSVKEVIGTLRNTEAVKALRRLGVSPSAIHFLGYVDSELSHLLPEQRNQLIGKLAQLIQQYRPEEVYVPHRSDGHPDHEATYAFVVEAVSETGLNVRMLQYSIWLTWLSGFGSGLGSTDFGKAICVPVRPVLTTKSRATSEYKSQITHFPIGFLYRCLTPYEIFYVSNGCNNKVQRFFSMWRRRLSTLPSWIAPWWGLLPRLSGLLYPRNSAVFRSGLTRLQKGVQFALPLEAGFGDCGRS